MEKTVKIRAYADANKGNLSKTKLSDEKSNSLEIEKKDALLEEEKSRSLEHIKTIVLLRENLKKEQEKNADLSISVFELQAKLNKLSSVEDNQLVKKNTLLEEEKKRSADQLKVIESLRENIKHEQVIKTKFAESEADLRAKLNNLTTIEDNQLVKKNAELEYEKKKSLELSKSVEQLKENLKLAQNKSSELEKKIVEQDFKAKELAEMLRKISSISAGV
jgi:hypothetical protein